MDSGAASGPTLLADEERAKMIARIKALRAKQVVVGCTEQEALLAAQIAHRLMEKYDLTYVEECKEVKKPLSILLAVLPAVEYVISRTYKITTFNCGCGCGQSGTSTQWRNISVYTFPNGVSGYSTHKARSDTRHVFSNGVTGESTKTDRNRTTHKFSNGVTGYSFLDGDKIKHELSIGITGVSVEKERIERESNFVTDPTSLLNYEELIRHTFNDGSIGITRQPSVFQCKDLHFWREVRKCENLESY